MLLSIESDGFEITYKQLENNNMPRCHTHTGYELYYAVAGERYLFANKKCYTVIAGDAFIIPPGVEHRTLDGKSGGYTSIVCNIPKMQALTDVLPENNLHFVRTDSKLREHICRGVEKIRLALLNNEKHSSLTAISTTMDILSLITSARDCSYISQADSPTLDRVGDIMSYIETHISENISLSLLSERFFISEYYLSRLFKQCTGRKLWDYVSEMRIEKAKSMLINSADHINVIGKKCGFASVSAFGIAFRKYVGISAGAYRKANKNQNIKRNN